MQVCAHSHVCARAVAHVPLGYKSSDFSPKRSRSWSRLIIGFPRSSITSPGDRAQPYRQLRNHIISVPPGIIYSQTSVVICVYFYAFINGRSISTSCGWRRGGRHRDSGHDLPGREQSDNGGVRPYESGVEGGGDARKLIGSPRWIVYGVNFFILRIAATSKCHDFEIIPATSSRVCCGDEVATFRIATRALEFSLNLNKLTSSSRPVTQYVNVH